MARGRSTIRQTLLRMVPESSFLLVAVSGGKDSVALLAGLVDICRQKKITLTVAHVNHGLRGAEGNRAAKFVRALAEKHELHYFEKKLKNPPRANIEAWGRKERYKFFTSVVRKQNIDWVVTAHTANDLTENYFIRLLSNKHLGSIAEKDDDRKLLRPLLGVSRTTIEEYIEDHNLDWREDSTNSDTSFLRNKIRHSILPFLRSEMGTGQVQTLAERLSELADKENAIQDMASASWDTAKNAASMRNVVAGSKDWVTCLRNTINALDYKCLKLAVVRIAFSEAVASLTRQASALTPASDALEDVVSGAETAPFKLSRALSKKSPRGRVLKDVGQLPSNVFEKYEAGGLLPRLDSKNLLAWVERKVQAVNLAGRVVLRGDRGGFKLRWL